MSSATSGYYQDNAKRKQKMTIPKWAKVVIPSRVAKSNNSGNDGAAVGKSKSSAADNDDQDQSLSSSSNRRRSSRLSSAAMTTKSTTTNNDITTTTSATSTTKGFHADSNNSSIGDEELLWRQWYYRLYVMEHIEVSMIKSLERLFQPWIEDIEAFLKVHTIEEEEEIADHDDDYEEEEHDQQSLSSSLPLSQPPSPVGGGGSSSNKKPRLEKVDDVDGNDKHDLERNKKELERERLIEQYSMVPSTTYSPHLLPIIILQTTTSTSTSANNITTSSTTQQTSIVDRHCLMNYFVYRWKQLHTNTTATVVLSLDMLSSSSSTTTSSSSYASLHDVVYAIVVQCIQQETNPALKQYLQHKLKKHQTSMSATTSSSRKRQMRKRERSYSDLLFAWAKYTTTYTNIVVCFHDFGSSSSSCRKLRSDIMQLFTSWRSGEYYFSGHGGDDDADDCCCLPISVVLFDSFSFRDPIPGVSTNSGNDYFYNPHDFLATSMSSCQGLDGIKIKHVSLSCNDWLNHFWISYNSSTLGHTHHISNTILKRLQDDYYIHHKSVYELITQLKHVIANELSSKGKTAISHWCQSLMAIPKSSSTSGFTNTKSGAPTPMVVLPPTYTATNWQAGLFVWFASYVTAKKYVLSLPEESNDDDDDHDDYDETATAMGSSRSISTGRDLFQYYETMKKSVARKYTILLSIVTWLIEDRQITSPLLLSQPPDLQQQQQAEHHTANLPSAHRLLQNLGHVRNLLLLSINDKSATAGAAVGNYTGTSNGSFLNRYLNRKECLLEGENGLDSNEMDSNQTKKKEFIINSIIVDKIESLVTTANELIVLVGDNQKHREENAKTVETNHKFLYFQWQELVEQIQNIVDKLGLFMKRHPNSSCDDAVFYDSLSSDREELGVLSSTVCESLVAHNMRHELVEAAISNVPETHYLTRGASKRGKGTRNIPISEVPGILMRALLLKDRITIPRNEWFELFCITAWERIPDLDIHKNPGQRQQLADLFVCGTWYLVHSGFVQEKVQPVPASEQGRRSGMIVVYEKTSLVWCSGGE